MDQPRPLLGGLSAAAVAFLALLFLLPLGNLLVFAFTGGAVGGGGAAGGATVSGVSETGFIQGTLDLFGSPRTQRILWQTLWGATVGTALSVVLAIPIAWTVYCHSFPGARLIRALIAVPFTLPTVVVGAAFKALIGESPIQAVLWAFVFFNLSLAVRSIGTVWAALDPRSEMAALSLGRRPATVLVKITLPRLAPAIASAAALIFLFCATAYGVVLMLGGSAFSTIETEIYYQTVSLFNFANGARLCLFQLLIVGVCLLVTSKLERNAKSEHNATQPRSVTSRQPKFRAQRWTLGLLALLTLAILVVVEVIPLVALVTRSLLINGQISFQGYVNAFTSPQISGSIITSLVYALVASTIALVIGFVVSFLITRRTKSQRAQVAMKALDFGYMMPLGVSAVTLGFGYLLFLRSPFGTGVDLRTAVWIIPLAQALVAIPFVLRFLLPAFRAIPDNILQASSSLGSSGLRTLFRIELPRVLPAFKLAAGYAFAITLGEFGATSFLAKPTTMTVPVQIYALLQRPIAGNFQTAMALSVLMALIVVAIMFSIETRTFPGLRSNPTRPCPGVMPGSRGSFAPA